MSQDITLKVSGLYTSPSDFDGAPDGSLNIANNIECRFKNIAQSRRGFQHLEDSQIIGQNLIRNTDFYVDGIRSEIGLTDLGNVYYYVPAGPPWTAMPGLFAGFVAPHATLAKSRFAQISQNLYITDEGGIRSVASGPGSKILHSGVQKGLNLFAATLNGTAGFLHNNEVGTAYGVDLVAGSNLVGGFSIDDPALAILTIGDFVSGGQSLATVKIQNITYTATEVHPGTAGNAITIEYTAGGVAGAEVVTVNGLALSISIDSGVSTAAQIIVALSGSQPAMDLVVFRADAVDWETAQVAVAATNLAGGIDNILLPGTKILDINPLTELFGTNVNTETVNDGTTNANIYNLNSITGLITYDDNPLLTTLITGAAIADGAYVKKIAQGKFTFICTPLVAALAFGNEYTNNGHSFFASTNYAIGATILVFYGPGSGTPTPNGNLVRVTGAGDNPIVFAEYSVLWEIQIVPPPIETAIATPVVFWTPPTVELDLPPIASGTNTNITVYKGSQVKYQMVFGRVETDINGKTITRLGAPSEVATIFNNWYNNTNTTVIGTIPKNCEDSLTFWQLYRSAISSSYDISPTEEYQLVHEAQFTPADFAARTITHIDTTLDAFRGASLYSGADQQTALQENHPPPMAWDLCAFRDFALYGNITQPSTLEFALLAVGDAGIAAGDTITITASTIGIYTAVAYPGENAATQQFAVYTDGTPSQNIENTMRSFVRVVNFDDSLLVHARYISTAEGLPGKVLLESDYPVPGTFTATASDHAAGYEPVLTDVVSKKNINSNGLAVSKSGLIEAVPATNVYQVGDSRAAILRVISSSDYALVIKTDGIYKVRGYSPATLTIESFDLTTKCIGPDTVVDLNSQIWMFSNQGIVAISDSGVEVKSLPIKDIFDKLMADNLANLIKSSFAIGYDSDSKYILCLPSGDLTYSDVQYGYNFQTNCWSTWSRNLQFGYVHTVEDDLYICRADATATSISYERNNGSIYDYSDESIEVTITAVTGNIITLVSVVGISEGDALYQTSDLVSRIKSVDVIANTVTVYDTLVYTIGDALILPGITCTIQWPALTGETPSITKQFSEGLVLLKENEFNIGYISFMTDFSNSGFNVPILGNTAGGWGLDPWGITPWDRGIGPSSIRFLVTADEQYCSVFTPTLQIRQALSQFQIEGLSLNYLSASEEVGK